MPLTLLPQDAGVLSPATLDGSPYGIYYKPSQSGTSTKWTVSIEGGGWCYDEASCLSRSKTALGTSKAWPPTMPFSLDPAGTHFRPWEMGCMNALNSTTLDMDCHAIYLPYGDGASFAGYRPDPWPVPGSDARLWFRGTKNLEAAIAWALERGLSNATEVVVTGVSAGGLSSFMHMDRISRLVRRVNPSARVRGAPVVGFFLDHANFANNTATSYTSRMQYLFKMQNLTSGADGGIMPACAAAFPADQRHNCFMAPHVARFVQTPFFVFNSRFDAWQLANVLQIDGWGTKAKQDAVVQYGADFLASFQTAVVEAHGHNNSHGAFISTCICHACPFPTLELGGKTSFEHYTSWYVGATAGGADSMHIDTRPPNGGGTLKDNLCAAFPSHRDTLANTTTTTNTNTNTTRTKITADISTENTSRTTNAAPNPLTITTNVPRVPQSLNLSNSHLNIYFGQPGDGHVTVSSSSLPHPFHITNDSFAITTSLDTDISTTSLDTDISTTSTDLTPSTTLSPGNGLAFDGTSSTAHTLTLKYTVTAHPAATIDVVYTLMPKWTSFTKHIVLSGFPYGTIVQSFSGFGITGASVSAPGCEWAKDYGSPQSLNHAAAFHRCTGGAGAQGLMVSVANPYPHLGSRSVGQGITADYSGIGISVSKLRPVFTSDRVVMAPYSLRSGWVRAHSLGGGPDHSQSPPSMLNTGERDIFVAAVTSQLLPSPAFDGKRTIKVVCLHSWEVESITT